MKTRLLPWALAFGADKVRIGFLSTLSGPGAGLCVDIRAGFNPGLRHAGGKWGGLAVGPSVFASKTFYVSANAGPSQYAASGRMKEAPLLAPGFSADEDVIYLAI